MEKDADLWQRRFAGAGPDAETGIRLDQYGSGQVIHPAGG